VNIDSFVWEGIRASGLVAYALLSASVLLGVAVRARALDGVMKRPWVYEAHQTTSVLSLVALFLHLGLLLANRHIPFNIVTMLVPFASDWRPLPTGLGIIGLYLMLALTISSYMRGLIGQRTWRVLHYASFAAWVVACGHGIASGSDSGLPIVQYVYLGTGAAVMFLVVFRILTSGSSRRPLPSAPQA
jgi:predicted ferric reductase